MRVKSQVKLQNLNIYLTTVFFRCNKLFLKCLIAPQTQKHKHQQTIYETTIKEILKTTKDLI